MPFSIVLFFRNKYIVIFFLKIISVLGPLVLYAVMARRYSAVEFGYFQYIMSLLAFTSLLEAGVISSFRNSVLIEKNNIITEAAKALKTSSVIVVLIAPIALIITYFVSNSIYISLGMGISCFLLHASVFTAYYDLKDYSVYPRLLDAICYMLFLCVTFVLVYLRCKPDFIFFILCLARVLWIIVPLKNEFLKIFSINVKFSAYINKVYIKENTGFLLIQVLNSCGAMLSAFALSKGLGLSDYGIFSIYQRFFLIPFAFYSAVAPILWVKFGSEMGHIITSKKVHFKILVVISAIYFFISAFLIEFIPFYAGERFAYSNNFLVYFSGLMFSIFLVKDILSTMMHSRRLFMQQSMCAVLYLTSLLFLCFSQFTLSLYISIQIIISLISFLFMAFTLSREGANNSLM